MRALETSLRVTRTLVEDGWPSSFQDLLSDGAEDADACLFFVRFRELREQPPFDWQQFAGSRIMYDWDAVQNYQTIISNRYLGAWPEVIARHGFDTLVCTGGAVAERFRSEGIPAIWIPKGYEPERFFNTDDVRSGVGHYGAMYPACKYLLQRSMAAGVEVQHFRTSLNAVNLRV